MKPAVIKPYRTRELADLYEVSVNTFKKWLRPFENELGPKEGIYYSIKQVELIFSKLGHPYVVSRRSPEG